MNITEIANATKAELINETIKLINETTNKQTIINNYAQTQTLLFIILGITILTIAGTIFYYEKTKKITKQRKETQEALQKLVEAIEKADKDIKEGGKLKIREININNLPEELKTRLLDKTDVLNQIFNDAEYQT